VRRKQKNYSLNLSYPAFISFSAGIYKIRVGSFTTLALASSAAKSFTTSSGLTATAVGNESNTFTVVDMNTGKIVFEFCPVSINTFSIKPIATGSQKTKIKNASTYYYGDFEFFKNSLENLIL
jgi:hypothetical protein